MSFAVSLGSQNVGDHLIPVGIFGRAILNPIQNLFDIGLGPDPVDFWEDLFLDHFRGDPVGHIHTLLGHG